MHSCLATRHCKSNVNMPTVSLDFIWSVGQLRQLGRGHELLLITNVNSTFLECTASCTKLTPPTHPPTFNRATTRRAHSRATKRRDTDVCVLVWIANGQRQRTQPAFECQDFHNGQDKRQRESHVTALTGSKGGGAAAIHLYLPVAVYLLKSVE
jgi:hypothetical protein